MKTTMQNITNWKTNVALLVAGLTIGIPIFEARGVKPGSGGVTPLCVTLDDDPADALVSDGDGSYCGDKLNPPFFNQNGQFVFTPRIATGRTVFVDLARCVDSLFCNVPTDYTVGALRLNTVEDVRTLLPGTSTQAGLVVHVGLLHSDGSQSDWFVVFGDYPRQDLPCTGGTKATVTRSSDGNTWTLTAPADQVCLFEAVPRAGKKFQTDLEPRARISFPFEMTFSAAP